jgi:hypothetical protein
MCGDQFWDALTMHPEVRQTYINWPDAAKLRDDVGNVWESFKYGNILFFNYRSTDDAQPASGGVTGTPATPAVGVSTDHCSFFPLGASALDGFEKELAGYRVSKGTLHFPLNKPLPAGLVKKIVKARIAQNEKSHKRSSRG